MRTCTKCKKEKSLDEFHNKSFIKENGTLWKGKHAKCKACLREYQRNYKKNQKMQVLEKLGGKCECCGETAYEFLTIDHPDGDGKKHREEMGGGSNIYYWLLSYNFPEEYRVRLLCFNCNCARAHFGYCPHES